MCDNRLTPDGIGEQKERLGVKVCEHPRDPRQDYIDSEYGQKFPFLCCVHGFFIEPGWDRMGLGGFRPWNPVSRLGP